MATFRAWGFFWSFCGKKSKISTFHLEAGNNLLFVSIYQKGGRGSKNTNGRRWQRNTISPKLGGNFFRANIRCLQCGGVGGGEKWGGWRQVKIGQSLFFSTSTSWLLYLIWGGARQKKQIHASWCCWLTSNLQSIRLRLELNLALIIFEKVTRLGNGVDPSDYTK